MRIDATYIENCVVDGDTLSNLTRLCESNPELSADVYKNLSWELFDKVYLLSLEDPCQRDRDSMMHVVTNLCNYVRQQEMFLMIMEKLSSCNSSFSFQLLLHATQVTLIKSVSIDMWKQGKIRIPAACVFHFL